MLYRSSDGVMTFSNEVDTGFLLDGEAYVTTLDLGSMDTDLLPLNTEFALPFSFVFCNERPPGFFPESIIWDPQLSVLFVPPINPASPASKPLLALYIVLPIVVVIIVSVIVVVVVLRPRWRGDKLGQLPHADG